MYISQGSVAKLTAVEYLIIAVLQIVHKMYQ